MATTYSLLANFAQSAGILYFLFIFLCVLFYALRPGNRDKFDHAANSPLQED